MLKAEVWLALEFEVEEELLAAVARLDKLLTVETVMASFLFKL